MQRDLDEMLSLFAAKGRSGSGATFKAAIEIFERRTAEALESTLGEAAKLIEHRGRAWGEAMTGVSEALELHLQKAPEALANAFRVGRTAEDDAASKRRDELLDEARGRLRAQLEEFRGGWTAPVPKPLKDRHPFVYAVLLLIVGAVVGALVKAALSDRVPAPCAPRSASPLGRPH